MTLACFDITYRNGVYRVSVQNYNGGRVWTDEYVNRLREDYSRSLVTLSTLLQERDQTLADAKDHLADMKQIKEMLERLTRV